MDKRTALRAAAMALPTEPGVYIMKDAKGTVIYIGKAKILKNRVSQYFGADTTHTEKVRQMVSRVDRFDYIVTGSEFEALVLECSLIKQYSPKYNILLKDDKGYHYIRVSPPPYSRISEAKKKEEDGARYIGPYLSSYAIKQAVDEVNKLFELSTCNKPLQHRRACSRPCLNHYIGQCCAPCTGHISPSAYAERVEQAVTYLTQGRSKLTALLRQRMEAAAESLDFEAAARLRDRLRALEKLSASQKVVQSRIKNQDILAFSQAQGVACFEVFRFTNGALSDREHFFVDPSEDLPTTRSEFIRRYYSLRDSVPPRILLDGEVEDVELLERWLTEKAAAGGYRYTVRFLFPQRGESAQLLAMCRDNAAERVANQLNLRGHDITALEELRGLLGLAALPARIESYDISHTGGQDVVGGMVVFKNGKPFKQAYRQFSIKTVVGQDDYACMREVLTRRLQEYTASPDDVGFGELPDLILLDGGKGHVSTVKPVVDSFGYGIPVFGLVKDSHHRTRAITEEGAELSIRSHRGAFALATAIQDEVHRFAIRYHRTKHRKQSIGTSLTEIPGVGPKRAALLLRHFGTLRAVKAATVDQLCAVKGMTRPAAEAAAQYFHEQN